MADEDSGFNEAAVLAELEALQRAIEASRLKRQEKVGEFEAFVRGFRARPAATPDEPAAVVPPSPPTAPLEPRPYESLWAPPAAPEFTTPATATAAWARTRGWPRGVMGAAAAIGAIALVGVLIVRSWRGSAPDTGVVRPAVVPQRSTQAAPAATTPPSTPAAMMGELSAVRRVWVRVTADGQRTIERELAAGERVPLRADRSIVVRAGDAGAVRLTINGRDEGPLGKDGLIGTRTLTAPGAAPAVSRD
ncbi:MAG: DUF4115 domain-containing protein [Acidobacteria bacterium]|nr:DUF4115 domain-containing protein [Acidobacteriota bacterium]